MAGINPHVDSVYCFDGTLGPIFTVAIGNSEEMLGILPVLYPAFSQVPVRVFSQPNEIMVMDGVSLARILWAHGKPWKYPHEQYTLTFKFPELCKKTRVIEHHCEA